MITWVSSIEKLSMTLLVASEDIVFHLPAQSMSALRIPELKVVLGMRWNDCMKKN